MSEESIEPQKKGNILTTQLSMFSILPFSSSQEDVEEFCGKFWTVPLFGLVFGAILGIILLVSIYLFGVMPAATITIFSGYLFNRFLHFDGLMDFGDGLVAHGDQNKKIHALKDSNVGAGAVGVAIMVSILAIIVLSSCISHTEPDIDDFIFGDKSNFYWQLAALMFPICAEVLAKNGLYAAAAFGKPASGGLGEMFTSSANQDGLINSCALSAIIVLPLTLLIMFKSYIGIAGALLMAILMILASIGVGYAVSRIAMNSFGFVNGDVLGAANELSKVAVLMMALMVMVIW